MIKEAIAKLIEGIDTSTAPNRGLKAADKSAGSVSTLSIPRALARGSRRVDLTRDEARQVMEEIMTGQATMAQISAYLVAMRLKGEAIDEITGSAEIMRRHATKISYEGKGLLDTCGTGGDKSHTFNISTISALVAAGAGATVAKHGNRAVSSKCGSADLLKELGVNIEANVAVVEKCLKEIGIAFLFAPLLHESMKHAAPVRREIGIRTIFNILGPMTNPAGARHHLLGVFNPDLTKPLATALGELGSKHVLVVCGKDGLDEITTTAETAVAELKNGKVKTYKVRPADFGIKKAKLVDLKGADPASNAKLTIELLKGKIGPQRDIVILNAGAALYAADIAKSIKEGIKLAEASIDSGKAMKKLEGLKRLTNAG